MINEKKRKKNPNEGNEEKKKCPLNAIQPEESINYKFEASKWESHKI